MIGYVAFSLRNTLLTNGRSQVADFLIRNCICVSSVDFVRFNGVMKKKHGKVESENGEGDVQEDEGEDEGVIVEQKMMGGGGDDEDWQNIFAHMTLAGPVEYDDDHYTNPTIWIGVLPDTITGARAHELTRVFVPSLTDSK